VTDAVSRLRPSAASVRRVIKGSVHIAHKVQEDSTALHNDCSENDCRVYNLETKFALDFAILAVVTVWFTSLSRQLMTSLTVLHDNIRSCNS
jgi:hypothetical protein